MIFQSMLVKLYTIFIPFATNLTIIRRGRCYMLLQNMFMKIFPGSKVAVTLAALDPFLFFVHQSEMSSQFTAFEETSVTMRTVKCFLVRMFAPEVRC